MFLVWLGVKPFVVINEPELVKQIFMPKHYKTFKKGMFSEIMRPLLGDGLLLSEGKLWQAHHKLAAPAFQPAYYSRTFEALAQRINDALEGWEQATTEGVEVKELSLEFSRLTLDNIGIMAFGEHFGAVSEEKGDDAIFEEVAVILREMQLRCIFLQVPFWRYFPFTCLPSQRRFQKANDKIHKLVRRRLKRRKEQRRNLSLSKSEKGGYLLDALITAQEENGFTDKEVEDEMITTIMGGHETTSSLLSFAAHLLATHPHVQEKVHQELVDVMAHEQDTTDHHSLSFESLDKLKYLGQVIKEALRLFPSAPVLNRVVFTKEGMTIGGYNLPSGTQVLVCPWSLHRSQAHWPEPDNFVPERWADDKPPPHPFAYLPFSAGLRRCLGASFAMMEAKLVIAMLVARFELQPPDEKANVIPEMAITLRAKHGVRCALRKRRDN
ncbi:Cytochrome P450 4V2, variant 2 [Balamuthia mandrillaris]